MVFALIHHLHKYKQLQLQRQNFKTLSQLLPWVVGKVNTEHTKSATFMAKLGSGHMTTGHLQETQEMQRQPNKKYHKMLWMQSEKILSMLQFIWTLYFLGPFTFMTHS